jgi:hypothetical protein
VLFSIAPTFPTGTAAPGSVGLTGVLFTIAPTLPVGTVDAQSALTGVLLSVTPTFPTGTATPGDVTLTGVLFSVTPTFPVGTASSPGELDGVLFSVAPSFPVGSTAPGTVNLFGDSHLVLDGTVGNDASTANYTEANITGDIEFQWHGSVDTWGPVGYANILMSISEDISTKRGAFLYNIAGVLQFYWTENGSTLKFQEMSVAASTIAADGEVVYWRVTLDVDNGSSQHEVKFYYKKFEAAGWTQAGTTKVGSGTTSIHDATTKPVTVGAYYPTSTHADHLKGTVYGAKVLDGIEGTVVYDADFTDLTPAEVAAGSFVEDSVNAETVTLEGSAWSYVDGVLQATPTFPVGSVTAQGLAGVLLSAAPNFPVGAVTAEDANLTGVLFTVAPEFPVGLVALDQTLAGVLLTVAPSFPAGVATAGDVNLTGVLFSVASSFPVGAVTSTYNATGVLFSIAPTFPVGDIAIDAQGLTGVLFNISPDFGLGAVTTVGGNLDGVVFTVAPAFPTGGIFNCRTGAVGVTEVGIWEVGVDEDCVQPSISAFALVATFTLNATGSVSFIPAPGHIGRADTKVEPVDVIPKVGVGITSAKRSTRSVTVVRSGGKATPIKG